MAVLSTLRGLQELLKLAVEAWEENAEIAEDFDEADLDYRQLMTCNISFLL